MNHNDCLCIPFHLLIGNLQLPAGQPTGKQAPENNQQPSFKRRKFEVKYGPCSSRFMRKQLKVDKWNTFAAEFFSKGLAQCEQVIQLFSSSIIGMLILKFFKPITQIFGKLTNPQSRWKSSNSYRQYQILVESNQFKNVDVQLSSTTDSSP